MASTAGIAQSMRTYGAAVADYNGDGWPDIAMSGAKDPAHIYLGSRRGHFSEPFPGMFPHLYRLGCSWGDANADRLVDLFCATSADSGTDLKANELWVQQPDHSFVDQAALFGVADPLARGRHGVFVDVNRDGYQDLWIGNSNERPDGLPSTNRFLINDHGTRFVDRPSYGFDTDGGANVGPAGDLTDDGYPDLLSTSGGNLQLLRNDGGAGFTDVTGQVGLPPNMNDVWIADLNADGRNDIAGVVQQEVDVYLQRPDGRFVLGYRRTGLDRPVGVAAGDVNGDGARDLYVVEGVQGGTNVPDVMLVNGGDGTSFSPMAIPETDQGAGDAVVPIDYDRNGLTDFLVLNGRPWPYSGPVQLIAFFPA
jgi:hypothetical protein